MSERERERNGQLASPGEGKMLENREREREIGIGAAPTGWQGRRQPTEGFNCVCRREWLILLRIRGSRARCQAKRLQAQPTTLYQPPTYSHPLTWKLRLCFSVFVFRLERNDDHLLHKTTQPYHHKRKHNEIKLGEIKGQIRNNRKKIKIKINNSKKKNLTGRRLRLRQDAARH